MKYPYIAQRGTFLSVLSTLGFLILVEGGVCVLLIVLLIHNILIQCLLLAAMVAFIGYFFCRFFSVLHTQHQLTATQLHLRYGFAFQAIIPRTAMSSVQTVHERLTMFQPLQPEYQADKRRAVLCFSEQGQVELQLNVPVQIKFGSTLHPVEKLLINVDDHNEFMSALGLSTIISTAHTSTPLLAPQKETFLSTTRTVIGPSVPSAILVQGLTRHFARFVAVDDLHMTIQQGEIYGFLGSNGAGKTTTIKMLVGLLQPDAGQVILAGHDMWKNSVAAKQVIGYVADRALLYDRLSGHEFLSFLGQMRGLSQRQAEQRIAHLLHLLELSTDADRLCGSYSFGMKRKLSLAGALLHQPRILILDEPLNGLDPHSARAVKDLFLELVADGVTILLSTHDLATAEAICHRVGIIHKGHLLAEGSAAELRHIAQASDLEAVFLNLTAAQSQEVVI